MKFRIKKLEKFFNIPAPWALAVTAILAYGLLIAQLGFYWDDLPMSWIRYQLGPEAMAKYFSTNRPVWGLVYQATTWLMPWQPLSWQILSLVLRWITGILVWMLVRDIWTGRGRLALVTGLLFLVYPGFNQQWASYLYSHFFIVLSFFLLSFLFMIWGLRNPQRYWRLNAVGMLFSGMNLWMMEYFFVLELVRPVILWAALGPQGIDLRKRLKQVLVHWFPYLVVFITAVFSRMFVFNNQIYGISLASQFSRNPLDTMLYLLGVVLNDWWTVTFAAWGQVFEFPNPSEAGLLSTLAYAVLVLATFLWLWRCLRSEQYLESHKDNQTALSFLALGAVSLFLAGWPFWLVDLSVTLGFPANRFTLSFMLGTSFLLAGLIELIPSGKIRTGLAVVLVGLAVGRQFLWANEFRRDWEELQDMFWQMSWRIPALEPDTLILINEGPLDYYADNSISAPLNMIYAPDNHTSDVDYMLFYPTNRIGQALPSFAPGQRISHNFIAGQFEGNTSQVVVLEYSPPGCLRVLDPDFDPENRFLLRESMLREAAVLSTTSPILAASQPGMPHFFGPEPGPNWCYYFEKADLARQSGDWQQVADLGDLAFSTGDTPNNPVERFVFIEGYAHVGRWDQAWDLSLKSYRISKEYVGPLLCKLWQRIDATVPDSNSKREFVEKAEKFDCSP
ncbi:MAG: hypothetical protein JXA13_12525 [Anaerolineales bacterium]|nr:hypothetical protein [Anaerolineales bacterium]